VKVIICKPAETGAKGPLERAHDWLERSVLPTVDCRSQL
jgi:hypothetical protein